MVKNGYLSPCEVPVIVVTHEAKSNLKFLNRFSIKKKSKIKFHENSSSGSRIVLYGTDDGRADMTRITVAFHNFANASSNKSLRLQDTFLTMHVYVFYFTTLDNEMHAVNQQTTMQYQWNAIFFEALSSRWPVWETLSCSCPHVCSLTVDKTKLIGWDCALLSGNKWQLNEMLEAPFLHT
jgi:hypothetical protein